MPSALVIYLVGVLVGLWRTDGGAGVRIVHGLLWPVGPLAFLVTVGILLAASLVAFPFVAFGVAAAAVLWWISVR